MLGLRYGTVQIAPYHPEWAQAFLEERARLDDALQAIACQIEHVGSTAVPGLSAKPILDIAVGLAAAISLDTIITALTQLGYQYRGDAGEQGGTSSYVSQLHSYAPITSMSSSWAVRSGRPISNCATS